MKTIIIDGVEYNLTPKVAFREGEWVVSPNGVYWHIDKISNNRYEVTSNTGKSANWPLGTNIYHSFSIIDAKDGDVLVNQNGEMPFIFKECKDNHIYCYCGYTNRKDVFFDRFVNGKGEELQWLNLYYEQAYPATKEQREKLEKAIHEAGYEWDAEKKEVKKIKQEQTELPNGEDYGIDSLYHAARILEKTLGEVDGYQSDDGILEHKCAIEAVKRLYKQKPAWSEEDEEKINKLLQFVQNMEDFQAIPNRYKQYKDILKSLKERMKGE